VISLLRKQNSESVFSDFDVEQLAEEESLENSIVRRETADDILQRAPKLLSDLEYQVLLLHIQGYKTAQIAAALGKTAKSVDNAKFRLFRRLREELENPSEK
jgi:DNA-directed RNA polymerase specialized sigma24 family protein